MKLFDLLSDIDEGGRYPDAWIAAGNIGPDDHRAWYIFIRIPLFKKMTSYDPCSCMEITGRKTLFLGIFQYFLPSMEFPVMRFRHFFYPQCQ